MYHFQNDYNAMCHPKVLDFITNAASEHMDGYGNDESCGRAAEHIKRLCENRDIDVHFTGRFQNGIVCGNSYGFAVDGKIYSFHCVAYSMTMAFFGHPSIQAPHLMHFS